VPHVLIGRHGSSQIAHHLMHVDQNAPGVIRVEGHWLHVRIHLAPLLRPVSTDCFGSEDKAAFEGSGPLQSGVMRVRAASMSRALKAA
jgi:hypothetical protein